MSSPSPPFQILGANVPRLMGRDDLLKRISDALTKRSPSHVSIVGPRYSGKTVLLHSLAEHMGQADSPYSCVVLWDLGHLTPSSDDEFMSSLCRKLSEGLSATERDYSQFLAHDEPSPYDRLREVIDALEQDEKQVLFLWDGFDRPLEAHDLSKNLWDQLRELATNPAFRLVIASRRTLSDLISAEDSATSDFWGIFEQKPEIGIFEEADRESVLHACEGLTFEAGALSELLNWTGGFPPLFLILLNAIVRRKAEGAVTNADVNEAGEATVEEAEPFVSLLLNDLPPTCREKCQHLLLEGETPKRNLLKSEIDQISSIGFGKESGGKLKSSCRFARKYIENTGQFEKGLEYLFGTEELYTKNTKNALELRLAQLNLTDERLRSRIENALRDLPNDPAECLYKIRGVVQHVLELVWTSELGSERRIPAEITQYWTLIDAGTANIVPQSDIVREGLGRQVSILRLLVGARNRIEYRASHISKSSYHLLNALLGYGDYGQHISGETNLLGTAMTAIFTSLELADNLKSEGIAN